MNQLDSLTINNHLMVNTASTNDLLIHNHIHLGSHSFSSQQLGDLLTLLLTLHPELSI